MKVCTLFVHNVVNYHAQNIYFLTGKIFECIFSIFSRWIPQKIKMYSRLIPWQTEKVFIPIESQKLFPLNPQASRNLKASTFNDKIAFVLVFFLVKFMN